MLNTWFLRSFLGYLYACFRKDWREIGRFCLVFDNSLLSSEGHKFKLLKVQFLLTVCFLAVTEMKPSLHLLHSEQPGQGGGVPAHCRGLGTTFSKGPIQVKLLYDSMILYAVTNSFIFVLQILLYISESQAQHT